MHARPRRRLAALLVVCALAGTSVAILPAITPAVATPGSVTLNVNSNSDVPVAAPGIVCETATGNGVCTLRAAVQVANKQATAVTIRLQPGITYLLTRSGEDNTALNGDLDLTGTVTIEGGDGTVVDASGLATPDRVFEVTGTIVISDVTIQGGRIATGSGYGGGILSKGSLTVVNSRFLSNTLTGLNNSGGGIFAGGPLTVQNSLIAGNTIAGAGGIYGGGIYASPAFQLIHSTVSGNSASGFTALGGGIFAGSVTTTIANSMIFNNRANVGGGLSGGGTIVNSTISANTAYTNGGGINAFAATLINSTVSGNTAYGSGGGIYAQGTTALYNVTVAFNGANTDDIGSGFGGGIYRAAGTVTLANSIVAGNTRDVVPGPFLYDDDCYGTLSSNGYNILTSVDPLYCTVSGAYGTAWPQLGPLQNNGGPTPTHALPFGSPAINAGDPGGCNDNLGARLATDQRGKPRPVFGSFTRCDLGAFEVVYDTFLPLIRR